MGSRMRSGWALDGLPDGLWMGSGALDGLRMGSRMILRAIHYNSYFYISHSCNSHRGVVVVFVR
jgi:hypothetical protein